MRLRLLSPAGKWQELTCLLTEDGMTALRGGFN